MARAWVFQANPDHYDIDGALAALETIAWQTPQYASELRPGDPVVLWRSGAEAGIVGVARVAEPPREAVGGASEQDAFHRGDGAREGLTTVVPLRVAPCAFVPKAEVAELAVMAEHRIVTAPMGTVFPLDDEQWAALRARVPEPPEVEVAEEAPWPAAFSWQERVKSVNPLPGGVEAFQDVLAGMLAEVDARQPGRPEFEAWVSREHGVNERGSALVAGFLVRVGLLRVESGGMRLTAEGARWLRERDAQFLLALLHGRIRYLGEMLAFLERPRSTEELLVHANDAYQMKWTSRVQIVRRRHLLGGLGAVEYDEEGRLRRTAFGDGAVAHLPLAPPAEALLESVDAAPDVGEVLPDDPSEAPSAAQAAVAPSADGAEPIAERLLAAQHDSSQPAELERAVRDAFAFLGFRAEWLGGSGRTDVLLTAPLGAAQRYRVVVDAKTTAQEAVGDAQIDWVTIDEHQERHEADHAAVVAPAFRGDRLTERARRDRSVALLTVTELTDVLRQHETAPLDLEAYRALFDPEVGLDTVFEAAGELRRELVLAAAILRQVGRLGEEEGAVAAADLYWNLEAFAEHYEGQRAAREEIAALAEALARPPLSLLGGGEAGYVHLGARATAAARLRLLADLVEDGVPEIDV